MQYCQEAADPSLDLGKHRGKSLSSDPPKLLGTSSHLLQLIRGDREWFTSHLGDIVSPVDPGSFSIASTRASDYYLKVGV